MQEFRFVHPDVRIQKNVVKGSIHVFNPRGEVPYEVGKLVLGLEGKEGYPNECGIGYVRLNRRNDGAKMVTERVDTRPAEAIPGRPLGA